MHKNVSTCCVGAPVCARLGVHACEHVLVLRRLCWADACEGTCAHVHSRVRTSVCACMWMSMCTCVAEHVLTLQCVNMCTHMCVNECVHTCVDESVYTLHSV